MSREVAEAFRAAVPGCSVFSSAGGSPASCAAGLAVLRAIRAEGLQSNAANVGAYLRARFDKLAKMYPSIIGAIHGDGLYMGIELVRQLKVFNRHGDFLDVALEPATAETRAICERLLELGIVCQPAGARSNVLKMKPPLCLSLKSASFVADQIEVIMRDGWGGVPPALVESK